jgi:hypothetical protein
MARAKSSVFTSVAGQRLLSFRVQRLPSSLAGVYLTTHFSLRVLAACELHSLTAGSRLSRQSQSHITNESQSWYQAPSGAQDQIFVTVRHLRFCRCGVPSLWEDGSGPTDSYGSCSWLYSLSPDRTENTASNSSICAYVNMAAVVWRLLSHCLAMYVFIEPFPSNGRLCWFHNPGFEPSSHNIV